MDLILIFPSNVFLQNFSKNYFKIIRRKGFQNTFLKQWNLKEKKIILKECFLKERPCSISDLRKVQLWPEQWLVHRKNGFVAIQWIPLYFILRQCPIPNIKIGNFPGKWKIIFQIIRSNPSQLHCRVHQNVIIVLQIFVVQNIFAVDKDIQSLTL